MVMRNMSCVCLRDAPSPQPSPPHGGEGDNQSLTYKLVIPAKAGIQVAGRGFWRNHASLSRSRASHAGTNPRRFEYVAVRRRDTLVHPRHIRPFCRVGWQFPSRLELGVDSNNGGSHRLSHRPLANADRRGSIGDHGGNRNLQAAMVEPGCLVGSDKHFRRCHFSLFGHSESETEVCAIADICGGICKHDHPYLHYLVRLIWNRAGSL